VNVIIFASIRKRGIQFKALADKENDRF